MLKILSDDNKRALTATRLNVKNVIMSSITVTKESFAVPIIKSHNNYSEKVMYKYKTFDSLVVSFLWRKQNIHKRKHAIGNRKNRQHCKQNA